MKLQEVSALIDLATSQQSQGSSIQLTSSFLFKSLGASPTATRSAVPNQIAVDAAIPVLRLFNIPQDVSLIDVATALAPPATADQQRRQQQTVWLDSLVGLVCLLSSGETSDKLRLCYWTLDRNSSNNLTLQELLVLLPALPPAATAARLILKQATPQSLAMDKANPAAQAAVQQRMQMLSNVLQRAFLEADTHKKGALGPGEQFKQLLFNVAAALTAIIIDAAPPPTPVPHSAEAAAADNDEPLLSESGSADFVSAIGSMTGAPGPPSAVQESAWSGKNSASTTLASDSRSSSRQQQDRCCTPSSSGSSLSSSGGASPDHISGTFLPAAQTGRQQQQAQQAVATGAPDSALPASDAADVLIVDPTGDVLHYSCSVQEAAAAALSGKPPGSMAGAGLHVYPQTLAAGQGRGTLSPRASLTSHLSALAEGHLAGLQQLNSNTATATPQFLTPVNSSRHGDYIEPAGQLAVNPGSSSASGGQTAASPADKRAAAGASRRLIDKLKRRTTAETQQAPGVSQQAQAAVIEAAQANGGITTTAGAMLQSLQSNLAAASIRVLSYCGLCFLLTSLVVLGDAALVAGLHVGGRMPLAVAFGITVGANIMMMLMLVMVLVIVHIRNATEARSLQDRLNSPQAQQLDQVLVNLTEALAALKSQEAQTAVKQPGTGTVTQASSLRRLTSVYTPDRAASNREFCMDAAQAPAALGILGKLQPLWAAVGRIAGFQQSLQTELSQGHSSYEGGQNSLAVVSEDGTGQITDGSGQVALTVGRSSSSGQEGATPAAVPNSGKPPGGGYQQSRVMRVKGTAAPSAHPSTVGYATGGISVKEAYPM